MRYRLCENCSVFFEQGKAYCKLCGHRLADSVLSEPAKVCPRCGLLYGGVGRRCTFCAGELRALREAPAAAAVPRSRPLLSAAWMDWKVLAALAVVPVLVLTAAFLALQPGGSPPLPGRPPAVQGTAAEAERLNAEGIAAARAGRFAEAERALLAALEAQPDSPKARNNLGILYRRLGRMEEAIAMYEQAITLDPTNPVPHKNLGLIYEGQGRRAEALRHFERYRTLRPDAPDADEIVRKIARLRRA